MKSLYKMCACHSLLPGPLQFELHDDQVGPAACRGGSADVSKREYCGQKVAVKVLRVREGSDLKEMTNVGHWQAFTSSHVLAHQT